MLTLSRIAPRQHAEAFKSADIVEDGALAMQARLAQRLVAALEQGGVAAFALDPGSSMTLAANARFRALTAQPGSERELKAALRAAGPCATGLIWRGEDGPVHVVRRFAIESCIEASGGVAMLVTLSDPRGEDALRFADFVRRHGITRAEAKLMWRLLLGETLAEIACALSVSLPTVKSHLRSLLAKSGVGRQAALVALYYDSGARAETPPEDRSWVKGRGWRRP